MAKEGGLLNDNRMKLSNDTVGDVIYAAIYGAIFASPVVFALGLIPAAIDAIKMAMTAGS